MHLCCLLSSAFEKLHRGCRALEWIVVVKEQLAMRARGDIMAIIEHRSDMFASTT